MKLDVLMCSRRLCCGRQWRVSKSSYHLYQLPSSTASMATLSCLLARTVSRWIRCFGSRLCQLYQWNQCLRGTWYPHGPAIADSNSSDFLHVSAAIPDESESVLLRVHCELNLDVCHFCIEGRHKQRCIERWWKLVPTGFVLLGLRTRIMLRI